MTLPYGLLMGLMPPESHGAVSSPYGFSRGLGTVLGPLIAGAAIDLLAPWLQQTRGYSAMWLVAGVATLASVPRLRSLYLPDQRVPAAGMVPDAGPISESVHRAPGAGRSLP